MRMAPYSGHIGFESTDAKPNVVRFSLKFLSLASLAVDSDIHTTDLKKEKKTLFQ